MKPRQSLRIVILALAVLSMVSLLPGCTASSSGGGAYTGYGPQPSDPKGLNSSIMTAVSSALSQAMMGAHNIVSKGTTIVPFNYSGTGFSVAGTVDTNSALVWYKLDATFTNYGSSGVTLSGSIAYSLQIATTSPPSYDGSYIGRFTATYLGTTYDINWVITIIGNPSSGSVAYSGIFGINGLNYNL